MIPSWIGQLKHIKSRRMKQLNYKGIDYNEHKNKKILNKKNNFRKRLRRKSEKEIIELYYQKIRRIDLNDKIKVD